MHTLKILIIVMLIVTSNLFSNSVDNGKDLYFKAKCQKCHTPQDYTSEKRKIQDLAKLKWRVKRCDFAMDAGWSDEDIEDVVKYLNESYYKFKE